MKKILIVEDDQIVANIYRNKFSLEGFQVEVANNGAVGLELATSFRPDAVILDLMLPQMTGVEFMKKVRAMDGFGQLPVIVFSNTYLTNMVQEAWKAGATKCLSKANCTPKQVIEVLRSVVPTTDTSHIFKSDASLRPPAKAAPKVEEKKVSSSEADAAFQAELRQSFIESFPATL